MNIKLNTLAVTISLVFIAPQLQAYQLIKDNDNDVKLTGMAYAGHFFGNEKNSANYGSNNFLRFGVDAKTAIDEKLTAIGRYEAQFKLNNPDSEQNFASNVNSSDNRNAGDAQGTNIRTRLIFIGLGVKDIGTFTFGRQWSPNADTFTGWTDIGYTDGYTGAALGLGTDRFASARASDVLKYSGVFGKAHILASYKFKTKRDTSTLDKDNSAYNLAMTYDLPMHMSVGAGFINGNRPQSTAGVSTSDPKLYLTGLKYDDSSWYAAVTASKGTDFLTNGVDHKGIETALRYTFTNGFGLLTTWEKQTVDVNGKSLDSHNSTTLGAIYNFNQHLSVSFEYRINSLDKNAWDPAAVRAYGDYSKTSGSYNSEAVDAADDYQFAVKYLF
ncbi:porin [Vibrio spartinae]|uniref:Outer membrane porin protein OmpD n=1 Tax=Vibrio spartinae TaxID=1918945 RepID=A0A1N6M3R1_9VIBR|nr:porin [Vibrio spartinae]QMV14582.1 Outer membrane porin protein OmpD precursor [Vibrio spartinae]SIO94072.1 Outer membrane porin protein OmpD precursor [Vibrio spartinae]